MRLLIGRRQRWLVAFAPFAAWVLIPFGLADMIATAIEAMLLPCFLLALIMDAGNRKPHVLGAALSGLAWALMVSDARGLAVQAHAELALLRSSHGCAPSYRELLASGQGWQKSDRELVRPVRGQLGANGAILFRIAGDGIVPYDGRRAVARYEHSRDGVSFPCLSPEDQARAEH